MSPRSTPRTPELFPVEEQEPETGGSFVDVALNRPMRREYTYRVPEDLLAGLEPGMRVAVPFLRGREVGVVVRLSEECDLPRSRLKPIARVLDTAPVVDAGLLELTRWMARRYACAWGEALGAVLPAPLKREAGTRKVLQIQAVPDAAREALAELEERQPKQHRLLRTLLEIDGPVPLREVLRSLNLSDSPAKVLRRRGLVAIERVEAQPDELLSAAARRPRHAELTADQAQAVETLTASVRAGEGETFLLQGVTGSGKTEVYLRVIERALELGRGGIVLVPEIALTPQTVGWFRSRFGAIGVLHSRMTDAQRLAMWRRVQSGEARVVVGARSAVFAPVADLGVIVVDEEHEPSFKQGNVPRYHARDVAVERARRAGAVCVLGSATPSLETWYAAREGGMRRLRLPRRIGDRPMPAVDVIDMRGEGGQRGTGGAPLFSRRLGFLLKEAVEEKEQAILFLNRRGFTTTLWCPGCKEVLRCVQCSLGLTLHRRIRRLVCHGCCDERTVPPACPLCSRPGLKAYGAGSERVERELRLLLPGVRLRRMDSDTMRRREDYEETLAAFERRELDVLVGTQMIAKGLDFPNVTVVGIVSADEAIELPDFRATERTFQLIAQVAGRAGRGERPGRIVVQAMDPTRSAIRLAARHAYDEFAEIEQASRRVLGFPPHGRLIRVLFEDREEARVAASAAECVAKLERELAGGPVRLRGPSPAPISLLRGRHRHHVLVMAPPDGEGLATARDLLVELAAATSRPHVAIDVDPVSML